MNTAGFLRMFCIPITKNGYGSSGKQSREDSYLWSLPSGGTKLELYLPAIPIEGRKNYMKKPLKLPEFKNEDEEREFWATIDLSEYYEPSDLVTVSFPNLKPTTRSISIRLPEYLIN